MCKYCDSDGMQENLIESEVPLFGLKKDECIAEFAVWICDENLIMQLDRVNETSIDNGDLGKIKIHYCPICGRKLNG